MPTNSLRNVDTALNKAERHFDKCWSYLVAIKGRRFSKDRLDPIVEFQPLLATALFSLSRLHAEISKERQARIASKSRYSLGWFSRRMAFLDRQQERLGEAMQIGRSIGDAYAWFFYQNELEFLRQHSQEPKSGVMSTGVGGIGELQCARNMRFMGEYFVVHHCITGMLRLGDVTLINLNGFKVAGIGELKSHSDKPGHVTVSISVLGDGPRPELGEDVRSAAEEATPLSDVVEQLTNAAKSRLQRQMKRIQTSHEVARKKPDSLLSLRSDGRVHSLQRLLNSVRRERVSFARAGNGLVLFAYRFRSMPLSKRLDNSTKSTTPKPFLRGLEELPNQVLEVVISGREDNALLLSWFYYRNDGRFEYLPGMTHPFWWPISPKLLKAVVFKRVIVGSAYNPAWLFKELEDAGFVVETSDARQPKITRRDGDALFQAEGVPFYFRAIQEYLMEERVITSMLTTVFESTIENSTQVSKRVDLLLYQKFGRPNDDEEQR